MLLLDKIFATNVPTLSPNERPDAGSGTPLTLNENTGFCELRLSSTSPAKVEAGKGEETARIDRRRTIVKGLAGLGVVAAGAVGLSALGGRSTAAIQDATFLVQRSEEHTSELQSRLHLVCRLLLEKKKKKNRT